jgi:hypothetical protein
VIDPFVAALNATPRVALMPLIVLWFGIGVWSKVAVIFLGQTRRRSSHRLTIRVNEGSFRSRARARVRPSRLTLPTARGPRN